MRPLALRLGPARCSLHAGNWTARSVPRQRSTRLAQPGLRTQARPHGRQQTVHATAAPPGLSPEQVQEVVTQLQDVPIPEELTPLKAALDAARTAVEKATADREDLEAKAQQLTSVAISAKDELLSARKELDNAVVGAESATVVKLNLANEVDHLHRAAEEGGGLQGASLATGTVELTDAKDPAQVTAEPRPVTAQLEAKRQQLDEIAEKLSILETTVKDRETSVAEAESSLLRAEERSSEAMLTAEAAVHDEMEAFTVAKEIQSAFSKALNDLNALNAVFEANTNATKSKEQAQAERDTMAEARAHAHKVLKDSKLDLPQTDQLLSNGKPAAKPQPTRTQTVDLDSRPGSAGQKQALAPLPKGKLAVAGALLVVSGVVLSLALTGFDFSIVPAQIAQVSVKLQNLLARLPLPDIPHGEHALIETIWILLASVVTVPIVCSLPGGSATLGFLLAGAVIGPHALAVIPDVEGVRHLAELGVVFLLFNIGLELSLERLQSMQKYVFGMGTTQFALTLSAVAVTASVAAGVGGPAAIILGGGLALSSTAVAMQVLQDRGETGSRHGRATFAILLLQDLAVVVLLMLVPLLAPQEGAPQGAAGMTRIAKALGIAAIKAVTCIVSLIAGGRVLLRPLYRLISKLGNEDIFQATTILVVLGTSMMTQLAGLSLALGAFLAGLLLAETEFALQVESDIAPYKGLLMGLFFMTVGMEISVGLFFAKWQTILLGITVLVAGKTAVMAAIGQLFGLSKLQSVRAGLLLAAGGEFAFVTFQEAIVHGILPSDMVRQLFLVVALSMAATPFLAEFGQRLGKMFEKGDMKAMQPDEGASKEMRDHVIIAGFGRVGQIIGQLLSERLIPFVALDVQAERVQAGQELDLPVYFGDAGSGAVLHSVGAHRAACAVITLDTPGANYRTVWALHKNFPNVKIYVRAHDVHHGLNLEKAGATAVVPETLEPSLQLAAAVLSQLNMPQDEVTAAIQQFRRDHISELQVLSNNSGSSLGYGFGGTLAVKEKEITEEGKLDVDALKPLAA